MRNTMAAFIALVSIFASSALGQKAAPVPSAASSSQTVACKVMEVFVAPKQGVNAVIFHQSDKADGQRLGALLKSYSGREMEFETQDGQRHGGTVYRVKSCFGRGLLIIALGEAKLEAKDEFVLRIPGAK